MQTYFFIYYIGIDNCLGAYDRVRDDNSFILKISYYSMPKGYIFHSPGSINPNTDNVANPEWFENNYKYAAHYI